MPLPASIPWGGTLSLAPGDHRGIVPISPRWENVKIYFDSYCST